MAHPGHRSSRWTPYEHARSASSETVCRQWFGCPVLETWRAGSVTIVCFYHEQPGTGAFDHLDDRAARHPEHVHVGRDGPEQRILHPPISVDDSLRQSTLEPPAHGCLEKRSPGVIGLRWKLKHEESPRCEHTHELRKISLHEARRNVLKNKTAVHQIEHAVVEPPEMRLPVDLKVTTFWSSVFLPCAGNHRWSDVDAVNIIKMGCEGASQAPDTAAKIEGAAGRQCRYDTGGCGHQLGDVSLACGEKVVNIPSRFSARAGQNGPQRIAFRKDIPLVPEPGERKSSATADTPPEITGPAGGVGEAPEGPRWPDRFPPHSKVERHARRVGRARPRAAGALCRDGGLVVDLPRSGLCLRARRAGQRVAGRPCRV